MSGPERSAGTPMGLLDKVVAITGAGHGLGRREALEVAALGGSVVVAEFDADAGAAVVKEIEAGGGRAVLVAGDVADTAVADAIVAAAVDTFGRLDAVVNNAGFLRDRTFVKMTADEWDDVIRVHLRGHYAVAHAACVYWRDAGTGGRLVGTSSTAGLLGNFGQANYGAAKAGIVAMSSIIAQEMARYGVVSNVVCPAARTRMTAGAYGEIGGGDGWDFWSPDNVAPMVAFLCSDAAGAISGKVFGVQGDVVELYEPFTSVAFIRNDERRWTQDELAAGVPDLFAQAGRDPGAENMMARLRFSMTDRSKRAGGAAARG
ncbi:SDR family NAD(P)-dependent oxidoreductase [Dactylosporangium sp. NBC_01737]|uniref:SDR family NAD(P)-dependent oxidoreductase n=1 Tax=Dactylosporangium sp. NBC_01737 TaxID=2975959 RepID=UPI002E1366DE|nr:SDR family NAD(P)-dependent oxidoreductase [Dactylosporangium sp. NBC_01737]